MQIHKVIKEILEIKIPKMKVKLPWILIHKIQLWIMFFLY
jgi:hypothetical protein